MGQKINPVGFRLAVNRNCSSRWYANKKSFAPMLEQMRTNSPESYRRLFAERNARWAGWIAQRLQHPGTVFVAVGAGHLAGRDSVQLKLAQAGVRSARIN